MKKREPFYTADDLLQDNTFLCWQLFSSDTDREYWERMSREDPDLKKEIEKASGILKTMKLNHYKLSSEEKDTILFAVQEKIRKKKRARRIRLYLSGAACACIASLFLFISYLRPDPVEPFALLPEETPKKTDIQLILSDSEVLTFEQDADIQYSNDGSITVSVTNQEATRKKIVASADSFNKLVVPRGKRSFLTLEDGTKVWVNSGSSLYFPPVFAPDKREIRVEGEIYIEVAKDKDKPFFVNTSEMKLEVLGTSFNVSSYAEDCFQSIVLVEGKVEVEARQEKIILSPDMMFTIGEEDMNLQKVDVYDHISWKEGFLRFSGKPLELILTRLSRYYDIPIQYEPEIGSQSFTGKLVLFDDFTDVMDVLYNAVSIQYRWEDDRIYIQKRE